MTNAEYRAQTGFSIDLGLEPAIEATESRRGPRDRRSISVRWLSAVVLAGLAGAALIGVTIYAAVDGQSNLAQAPERAVQRKGAAEREGLRRGDRLVKVADIVAEKQRFRAPTTVQVGDRQIVRLRDFTRVATTLTLTPTGAADEVPDFNPLKLMQGDTGAPDLSPDPGLALNDADVSFTTGELAGVGASAFGGALSEDEVRAQVDEFARTPAAAGTGGMTAQVLLMRTSRAGVLPGNGLGFADTGLPGAPFSSIEVRMVPENVTLASRTDPPRDAKDVPEKLIVIRHGETIEDVLHGAGASHDQVRSILAALAPKRGEAAVSEGRRVKLFFAKVDETRTPQVARLSVYDDETLETTIALRDGGDYVRVEGPDGTAKAPQPRSGDEDPNGMRLYESLYETALKQDIPHPVIDALVRIFANDVDFQRSVAGGDSFDAFYGDGEGDDKAPELLYASITVRDEVFKYYRFQTPDDAGADFYDEGGRSVRKFLIRNPVPSGQLTSGFGLRFHPILGYSRPHTGVDWAAPIGTPILAAGNGTVLRADRESAYGNHVEIQHANGYITTYSHMAGFARGIADGVKIRQGQVVGYLGQTGLATGPHLHYEVIVNGHFVDPMRVKLARTREISGKVLGDFKRERDRIDGLMASAPNAVATGADKRASN